MHSKHENRGVRSPAFRRKSAETGATIERECGQIEGDTWRVPVFHAGRLKAGLRTWLALAVALILAPAAAVAADEVYESPSSFIANAFPGQSPSVSTVTISGETAEAVKAIFGRPYRASRVRCYRVGNRTAWILDEIGKTQPITTGIVVNGGKIDTVKVLIYRESHGWEVRRPAFTKQFRNTSLRDDTRHSLSKRINGISGATLSVNALEKLSRLALLLHGEAIK